MMLEEYLATFAKRALPLRWQQHTQNSILTSKHANSGKSFADWVVDLENLNAALTNTKSPHALSDMALQAQIEANMHPDLKAKYKDTVIITTKFLDWISKVTKLDNALQEEKARTQCQIDASVAARAKCKNLLDRLSEPMHTTHHSISPPTTTNVTVHLQKLTPTKKQILEDHEGCTRCRVLYCDHARNLDVCPMKKNNTWPDPRTTKALTVEMAMAAKAAKSRTIAGFAYTEEEVRNVDTSESNSYVVNPSFEPPFSRGHIEAELEATGPAISHFPIAIRAILDSGCPSTVISDELAICLGLRRYPLPLKEDNLSSLSNQAVGCRKYAKMELTSRNGAWKSKKFKAKIHVGLPVPLLLGNSFLSPEQIVLDIHAHSATDKRTGYDLCGLMPPPLRSWASPREAPPSTQKRATKPKTLPFEKAPVPDLDGQVSPPMLMALVRECMENTAFQEKLRRKDKDYKATFADCFPLRLPDTTAHVPDHIYHCIRLKDPHKVVHVCGYAAPKKYHNAWKKLLDEHIQSGQMHPSLSEYSSPAFCIPKNWDGVPDLSIPPRWVNNY
ncbi:hypothetical protein C0991_002619 [Blastosporella zonata]|nr:hypothetical protein C0991_002619 [Blastosporella zonata]